MAQVKLDASGRPIDPGFFGDYGLGSALASLPGTPVLGGTPPSTAPPGYGAGTPAYDPTTDPNVPGGGFNGYRSDTGYGSPLAGSTPAPSGRNTGETGGSRTQTNPGTPPPNSTAGVTQPGANFWGDTSPFQQGVTGTQNNQTVPFASERYVTPQAAQQLGQTFGANVVSQNLNNMASPGSGAPSAPMYGLDFGKGDVQDASMGAFQLARGDRPEDVAARYAAGINNTGWGGPAPATSQTDFWNTGTPTSTYDPSQSNAQQAQLIQWLKGQIGG